MANERMSEEDKYVSSRSAIEHKSRMKYLDAESKHESKNQEKLNTELAALRAKAQAQLSERQKASIQKEIAEKEAALTASINKQEAADAERRKEATDWAKNEEKVKDKNAKARAQQAVDAALNFANQLQTTLDKTMSDFLSKQEAIAYNINGTGETFEGISKNLRTAFAGSGIVKQEKVYEKLADLVDSGIVYNAEQRAYLAAIAEDLGMSFDAKDKSLTRLINIYREDISANRMSIEASLKTFLNQNYETSQYIKEGFANVSQALFEAQSVMGKQAGLELEASVQKWLGSLSSVGLSTDAISNLAQAIGALGAGNISELSGNAVRNLIYIGTSRAGLPIGDLLKSGITSENADKLMESIVSYVASMNSNNNVVRSELARAFGLSTSDLVAASKLNAAGIGSGQLSLDISDSLLNKMDEYLYTTTRIQNSLDNFVYQWATDIADSSGYYLTYKALDLTSKIASTFLNGTTASIKFMGSGIDLDLGKIVGLVPLISTLPALIGTAVKGVGNLFKSTGNPAADLFNRLGTKTTQKIGTAGLLTGFTTSSGSDVSGSMIINTDSSDAASTAKTSAKDKASKTIDNTEETQKTADDIYTLLDTKFADDLATRMFTSKISTEANTVSIGIDTNQLFDAVASTAFNTANIYKLLLSSNLSIPQQLYKPEDYTIPGRSTYSLTANGI